MRKIVYTCDRCGAEIIGAAGVIQVLERYPDMTESAASSDDVKALFDDTEEQEAAAAALDPGWELCAECVEAVLRTLIRREKPRATVKDPLPDAPKHRGRPKKKTEEG